MDGGRRFLRSVVGMDRPTRLAYVGVMPGAWRFNAVDFAAKQGSLRARKRHASIVQRLVSRLASPGMGLCYAILFFTGIGGYGVVRGGQYQAFVAANGDPIDLAAKFLGFDIAAVTIVSERELTETEVLAAAQISPRNSLVFLDVAKVRDNLKKLSLIKEVSVTKLYPNRLLIEIEERQPFALWQKDGQVHIVAADGATLDNLRDDRFIHLPLVVGGGANEHLAEYLGLLEQAGDLKEKVTAGIFVGGRRWTLKLTNGVEILLPEKDAGAALAALNRLQRESRVLDKDILSLDFRAPDHMVARLTEEAAAARAESLTHKPKQKGGQT
jgi:cell division protein FtsQ